MEANRREVLKTLATMMIVPKSLLAVHPRRVIPTAIGGAQLVSHTELGILVPHQLSIDVGFLKGFVEKDPVLTWDGTSRHISDVIFGSKDFAGIAYRWVCTIQRDDRDQLHCSMFPVLVKAAKWVDPELLTIFEDL